MTNNLLLENQLCFALYAATNSIVKMYRGKLKEVGLTYPQYLVMLTLWQQDRQTVSAIAGKLKLDSATITPILKRIEASGLIQRVRSSTDERVVEVVLTESGQELESVVAEIQRQVACSTRLGDDEFNQLKDMLHHLADTLYQQLDDERACA